MARVNSSSKFVVIASSVFASLLSSLKDSKRILSGKNVSLTSFETVVICLSASIISFFGRVKLLFVSFGMMRLYSGNFPFISFVKKVYWLEIMIRCVSS